jgi:hypothetical protein
LLTQNARAEIQGPGAAHPDHVPVDGGPILLGSDAKDDQQQEHEAGDRHRGMDHDNGFRRQPLARAMDHKDFRY